jgi:hypothetical protein
LLTTAGMVIAKHPDPATLTLLFGSSVLITYSANRLLHMFDQAIRVMLEGK